jgi:hypothetical protein
MHFVIFPKTDFKPDNCQTLRGQIRINFIAVGTCNPTQSGRLTPDPEGRYRNLCKPRQGLGSLCNSYVQSNHLFPKPDTTLSNWKSSRPDLSVHLGSQNNKFCCFLSTAIQLNTPVTSPVASTQQYSFSTCPGGNTLIVSSQPADTTVCKRYIPYTCYEGAGG